MLFGVKDSQGKAYFSPARGYIDFTNPQAVITLFKDAHNPSTIIHESAYFFLNNLREAASLENAPVWVRRAWQSAGFARKMRRPLSL